jgi:hypothetical protein
MIRFVEYSREGGVAKGPMTITDPTALHPPKRSIVNKATQWTINTLAPLREHLSA